MYWCSADTALWLWGCTCDRKEKEHCLSHSFSAEHILSSLLHNHYLLCISTQICLSCDQLYENRFLIRAVVGLIYFLCPRDSHAVISKLQPKLLVQLFSEFEIFYCLSSSDCGSMTSPHVQCTVDLFTQTDGLAVQSHSPQNPFFFFSWCSTVPLDHELET